MLFEDVAAGGWVSHAPGDGPTSTHIWAADITLCAIKGKGRFEVEKEMCWRDPEEVGEGSGGVYV